MSPLGSTRKTQTDKGKHDGERRELFMNKAVMVGVSLFLAAPLQAQTPPPANSTAPSGVAAPAPISSGAAFASASGAWDRLKDDFNDLKALGNDGPKTNPEKVTALMAEAHDFAAQYPYDPNAFNATMLWVQLADVMKQQNIPGGPTDAEISQTLGKIAADEKVPKIKRAQISATLLVRSLQAVAQTTGDASAQWDAIEKEFDAFEAEFGANFAFEGKPPLLPALRTQEMSLQAAMPDKARYQALLEKLAKDPQAQIASTAQAQLAQLQKLEELGTKPLDLKFTSVDGKEIDLSQMRGKVVLIDFWATWCPPCREEVPNVVAAYNKYHDKGFEIIGISLDQDKDKLLAYTQSNGMVWPQYFDGQGWQNQISLGFGIRSIPAMWLVDKKGMLVTTNGRQDLAGQVDKLLAAP